MSDQPVKTAQLPDNSNHRDAKDLIKGALINYLGMIAKVSKVLFIFVVARVYGPTALGLYLLAWSVVDIASKFGLWGIDRSLIRDIARFNSGDSEQTKAKIFGVLRFNIGIAMGLSLLVTFALLNLSSIIALKLFDDPKLIPPLKLLSVALPFVVLTHTFIATTKALRIMRYEVLIRQALEPLLLLLGTLALIPLKLGATAIVSAHIIASSVAASSAAFVMYRKYRHLGWRSEPLPAEVKKDTIRYTSPMAMMDFLNLMVARIDVILVGAFINVTAAGLYGIAVEIISVIKRVRQGFEPIFSPIVSELYYNKQSQRLKRNYVLVTRWLMAGSLLPVVAIVLFPGQLLGLFNEQAVQAAGVLIVLALSHGIFGSFSAAESLLLMTGKSLLNTWLAAAMLAINVAVSLALLPKLGMIGVALGMLSAYIFISAARLFQGYTLFKLHPFAYALLWPIATAGMTACLFYMMGAFLNLHSSLITTVSTLILMALFYAGVYFMGAKEPEEKHIIDRFKNKLRKKPVAMLT
ncbi:oligosaccharide flippase family protein [candidate division KSB1 bacterium]|nr:oligosaccharide flippase family protein [candidate division KSB1 bacterium]NIR72704.1 oligosaccharide flippase family protein [candidate division KSB1 bacterium]NIS26789.1 oligosaccharide flippase family protein [candidate division KSB1 bacterium]NIT73583.1 oligosaccharide flippase family protein [candidate division KSB1 bacterium]NIU27459.1 oligosaccharide flippase family protein [candidate division KSB1 bacterium]